MIGESGPTDGPWRSNGFEVLARSGVRIANTWSSAISSKEYEANARLIAASPDLLEACKIALDAIERSHWHEITRAAIYAAIKKAEG